MSPLMNDADLESPNGSVNAESEATLVLDRCEPFGGGNLAALRHVRGPEKRCVSAANVLECRNVPRKLLKANDDARSALHSAPDGLRQSPRNTQTILVPLSGVRIRLCVLRVLRLRVSCPFLGLSRLTYCGFVSCKCGSAVGIGCRYGVKAGQEVGRGLLLARTSAGALNAAFLATHTGDDAVDELADVWRGLKRSTVFPVRPVAGFLGFFGQRSYFCRDLSTTKDLTQIDRDPERNYCVGFLRNEDRKSSDEYPGADVHPHVWVVSVKGVAFVVARKPVTDPWYVKQKEVGHRWCAIRAPVDGQEIIQPIEKLLGKPNVAFRHSCDDVARVRGRWHAPRTGTALALRPMCELSLHQQRRRVLAESSCAFQQR